MNSGMRHIGGRILLALLLTVAMSCARQATPGAHEDSPVTPQATSGYAETIKQIEARMASLDATVKAARYYAVHNDAEAIIELCDSLQKTAADPNSGVPRDKLATVTASAKELATAADEMHAAGHAGDVPRFQQRYADMVRIVGLLAQYGRGS